MPRKRTTSLKGNLFLQSEDQQSFTESQIQLLAAIGECGSITSAARKVGISYKTAWDRIDAMNNLSSEPLVHRSAGGARGGGTTLTEMGQQTVKGFRELQDEHSVFMSQLGDKLHSITDIASFVRNNRVRSSARNQYRGVITRIIKGVVSSEIDIRIGDSVSLTGIITNDSQKQMSLKKGNYVIALIKSSWVLISTDTQIKTSARNNLIGRVAQIKKGQVNSEVILDLGNEKSICAVVTNTSVRELKLKKGDEACAFFKASSVILMAD